MPCSVSRVIETLELAHVLVKRVSGTIKTEDQGTLPAGDVRVGFPFAQVIIGGAAREARLARVRILKASIGGDGDGDWTRQRRSRHLWG